MSLNSKKVQDGKINPGPKCINSRLHVNIPINLFNNFYKVLGIFIQMATPLNMFKCVIKVDMSFKSEIIELWVLLWSVFVQSVRKSMNRKCGEIHSKKVNFYDFNTVNWCGQRYIFFTLFLSVTLVLFTIAGFSLTKLNPN